MERRRGDCASGASERHWAMDGGNVPDVFFGTRRCFFIRRPRAQKGVAKTLQIKKRADACAGGKAHGEMEAISDARQPISLEKFGDRVVRNQRRNSKLADDRYWLFIINI